MCACAVAAIHADEGGRFAVSVHLRVDRSITSRVIPAGLKDETEGLWRPYGVYLEWTDEDASDAATLGYSLEAILERRIDEPDLPKWATVLGRASLNPDTPSRQPIRVSFDATEEVLALRKTSRASLIGIVHDHELARALGRVLAHEIGHVLLSAPYHDEAGLMRAVFRPDELAGPDRAPFRLTCGGIGRLRSRVRMLTGIEHEPIDPKTCIPGHAVR